MERQEYLDAFGAGFDAAMSLFDAIMQDQANEVTTTRAEWAYKRLERSRAAVVEAESRRNS